MAQPRTVQTAARAFAFLVLTTPIMLSASPFSVQAQDVIVKPQTPPQLVREEPTAAAPAAALPSAQDVLIAASKLPAIVTTPLLLDVASPPPVIPPIDPRSRQCSAHSDCVLVTDNCGMGPGVVNKAYIANWKAANFNITSNCLPTFSADELVARNTVVCLNNICGVLIHAPGKGPTELPPVNPAAAPAQSTR